MKYGLLKVGLLGLAIYGFYAFTVGKTLQNLEILINSVGRLKIKDSYLFLYFSASAENPNRNEITINELAFDILQNGTKVGRFKKYDANITIPGRSIRDIKDIEVRVNLFSAASNIINLFTQNTEKQVFTVNGYLKAGNMTIPVNQQLNATEE